MKWFIGFAALLVLSGCALFLAQRRNRHDSVSANAIVDVAADWQRDVSRAPLHLTRISDDEEINIGNQVAAQYNSVPQSPTPEETALEQYVDEVGSQVAKHAKRSLPWQFHLVPRADFINAFAIPGGHVFIGEGLLNQLTSEDELAFVLGHEIEHVDHRHAVERVQIEAQLRHFNLAPVAELVNIPMSLWQTGYSKDEEFEADREGLRIAVATGYSAKGAVDLLERWNRLHREYVIHAETPTDELSQLTIEGLNGYFRSHPLPSERLATVNEVVAHDHFSADVPLKPFHIEYEVTNTTH